jgi:ubiquitin-conjugating enzyme E2 R
MQTAIAHLQSQLKSLRLQPVAGFYVEPDENNIFLWKVYFAGPAGSLYAGGKYRATLQFPPDFPFKPPELRVQSTFWHPNVYDDGRVCISVLHAPGVDEMNTVETAAMRWTPVQTIEKVLIAFVSLLSDPDPSDAGAPANVDALHMFRHHNAEYVRRCKANAEKSLSEMPADIVIPMEDVAPRAMEAAVSYTTDYIDYDEDDMGVDGEDAYSYDTVSAPTAAAAPAAAAASASSSVTAGYEEEIAMIRRVAAGIQKTDEQLVELLKKHKRDVACVLQNVWG